MKIKVYNESTASYKHAPKIFGTYGKSSEKVNGYSYFTSDDFNGQYAIWYCIAKYSWVIGRSQDKGECKGYAHFIKDETCLECLPSWGWRIYHGTKWVIFKEENKMMISCLSNGDS